MLEELILTFSMWTGYSLDYILDTFDLDTFDRAYFLAETARARQEMLLLQIVTQASRGTEDGYRKFVKERLSSVGLDPSAKEERSDLDRLFHKLGGKF